MIMERLDPKLVAQCLPLIRLKADE